ncbi:Methyltransferase-like protein 27 [Paramyrothecium foliicola]|nr:Methyltransferase-like protein 27 [Paramyrothecium foliicola]
MTALIDQARATLNSDESQAVYAQWAATYNDDVIGNHNYMGPTYVAQIGLNLIDPGAVILDAGCGTGLVGQVLAKGGAATIDGIDLSSHMLDIARCTGAYRSLGTGDLNKTIASPDNTYDMVTCCGTFTEGHVGPDPAFREFVRVLKAGGVIVATVISHIWVQGGYKAEVDKLEAEGLVKVISTDIKDYVGADRAYVAVLQKADMK